MEAEGQLAAVAAVAAVELKVEDPIRPLQHAAVSIQWSVVALASWA